MIRTYIMDIRQLSEPEVFQKNYWEMMPERQKKIDAFRQQNDKLRSLGAGILLKRGLLELGIQQEQEQLCYGKYGKPYLNNRSDIQFNLSHAGDYAVAAFGKKELGIDMEQAGRASMKMASRFFTKKEQEYLKNLQERKKQEEAFIKFWTRKESFVKAVGVGLSFGIGCVETSVGKRVEILMEKEFPDYFFYEYQIEEYQIAVCSAETEIDENLRWVTA